MRKNKNKIIFTLRILISGLFLLSVFAKLYPNPVYGITKVFEQGQLIPMGFSESLAPYFSRFIIGAELFLAITILFNNYLKRIVVPLSFLMVAVFSIHLSTQLLGDSENCGCFGDLIPMTPFEALIKNIITLVILYFIYQKSEDIKSNFSYLVILFLSISTLMFATLPISSQSKSEGSSFISYVEDEIFVNNDSKKILCFFDAGCEHCQHAARSLDSLANIIDDFPDIHIIFSDTEKDKIKEWVDTIFIDKGTNDLYKDNKLVGIESLKDTIVTGIFNLSIENGLNLTVQIMPFANYETEEIDSYMEITFPDYDNPVVILYDGVRQIRLYEGTSKNEFNIDDLKRILENE